MYIGLELDVHESRGIYKIEGLHSVGDVHMSGHVCKFRDATGIVDFRDALELRGTFIALRCSINFRTIDYTSPHYFVN